MATSVPNATAEAIADIGRRGWGKRAGDTGNRWAMLHTADPGETGANEATGVSRVAVALNEKQTVTITGTPTGGTFTLTFGGDTTAGIAFDATAQNVEDALMELDSVRNPNTDWSELSYVAVTGGPGPGTPWVVEFAGALGHTDQALMTADGSGLTGGTTPDASVAETVAGMNGFDAYVDDGGGTDGRLTDNTAKIDFNNATAGETVTHGSWWDDETSTNAARFVNGFSLTSSLTYSSGQLVEVPAGDFDIVGAGGS